MVSNHVVYGVSFTFVLMTAWAYPLISPTWHDKQWFIGPAGTGAIITMEIGLTGYKLHTDCNNPSLLKAVKALCTDPEHDGFLGYHDLSELMDLACNAEETSFNFIRGCDTVKMLYYVSIVTMALLCISLLPMLAGCFGMLYFEMHETYETKAFCMAMFYSAPCVQLVAIGLYGMVTFQLDDMFDPAYLRGLFPVNLVINSPKCVTLAYGYGIAATLMGACFILPCFTVHYLHVVEDQFLYDECGNPISPEGYYAGEAYGAQPSCAAGPVPGYGQYAATGPTPGGYQYSQPAYGQVGY